ncbi:MAG: HAD family phosphatase [Erysipelotrichia bacterium]|nr:HAD family phosphatase [Erysipelotrichia bacterium]
MTKLLTDFTAEIKAVFFDIDGTTYQHTKHATPESTLTAFELLKQAGKKLCVVTSRSRDEMIHLPEIYMNYLDGIICIDGTDIRLGQKIITKQIPDKDTAAIISWLDRNHAVYRWVDSQGHGWINTHEPDVDALFDYEYSMVPPLRRWQGESVLHIVYYLNAANQMNEITEITKNLSTIDYSYVHHVFSRYAGKGTALEEVAQYWGFSACETAAFGDGFNDLELMEKAAVGIAMGNGCEPCQNAADYITETIDQDGFYRACVKFGWIK